MKSLTRPHTAPSIALGIAALIVAMILSLTLSTSLASASVRQSGSKRQAPVAARLSAARTHRTLRHRGSRPPAPAPEPLPVEASTQEPAPQPSPEGTPSEPESSPAPSPGVLFSSGFESGFSGWYVQSLPGRATVVSGGAFSGGSNARFEVRPGDVEPDTGSNRSEVSGPTFDEGQDLYIRDAIRVPSASTYQGPWQIVQQLHETEWSGSPGVAVFLDASRTISLGAGDGSPAFWQGPKLLADRWYELIYHVKLSQDPGVGFVEVWLDGVPQKLTNGQTKELGQTMQTSHVYIKAGIYRAKSSTGNSIVEHDGIVVANSLEAAHAG
jgi:hypothetical protein